MADIEKKVKITVSDDGQLKKTTKEVDGLNKSIDRNNKASKKHSKSSREVDRNMKGLSQMSSNASKNFSKQAQGMQGVLVPAYAEVAARVFALTAAYSALSNAADFSIMMRGQDLYAKQTGKNLAQVARSLQEASGYMLDFKEASSGAALATTAGLNTKQLTDITKVAKGASAALGRSLPDAYDRLVRGIVKGEPEILDELGLIVRLDKVYKDYADTLGITSAALTENQKLQARQKAVIEEQGLTKFGGIADAIPANQFEKLRASAFDLLNTLASGLTNVFNPIAGFLAESKTALYLIFGLIAKSLATKVFPIFDNIFKRFKDLPQTLSTSINTQEKKIKGYMYEQLAWQKKAAGQSTAMSSFMRKVGEGVESGAIKRGTTLFRAFGMYENGMPDQKVIKEVARNFKRTYNTAMNSIDKKTGLATRGLIGYSEDEIRGMRSEFDQLIDRPSLFVRGMSRMGAAVKTFVAKFKGTWAKTILAGMEKIEASQGRLAKGFSYITGALGKAFKALMVIEVVKMLGDFMLGLSDKYSKASEAASKFADSTSQALESINTTRVELDPAAIAGSFADALEAAEFKANIAESLSTAFNDAFKKIKLEVSNASDFVAATSNFFAELFGGGIADQIGTGIANGLETLMKSGYQFSDVLITDLKKRGVLSDDLGERLQSGTASYRDFQNIQSLAEDNGDVDLLDRLKATVDLNKISQNKFRDSLKDTRAAADAVSKSIRDLKKELAVKTKFDSQAEAFKKAIKALKGDTGGYDVERVMELFSANNKSIAPFSWVADARKELDDLKKGMLALNKVKLSGTSREANDWRKAQEYLQNKINGAQNKVLETRQQAQDFLNKQDEKGMEKLMTLIYGYNPLEYQKRAIKMQTTINELKQKAAVLDVKVLSNVQKRLKIEEKQFDLQIDEYEKLKKDLKENSLERLGVETKINDLVRERNKLYPVAMKNAFAAAKSLVIGGNSGRRNISEELAVKREELVSGGMKGEELTKQMEVERLNLMKRTNVEIAENLLGHFTTAISEISTSFKNALSDTIENYLTGEEKPKFRDTVGKGFLKAGIAGVSDVVTRGVMGRTGLLGNALQSVFGQGIADTLIPQTELEVAQDALQQLKEINAKTGTEGIIDAVTDSKNITKDAIDGMSGSFMDSIKDFGLSLDKGLGSFFNMDRLFGGPNGLLSMGSSFLTTLMGTYAPGGGGILGLGHSIFNMFTGANGGYAMGGFRAFANGGMVNKPTLGLVGEGKYNEAIVPLPDGKSIPVIGNTGGGNVNNVSVNVSIDSNGQAKTSADGAAGKELGYRISQAIQEEIILQQRPGGLLSSY